MENIFYQNGIKFKCQNSGNCCVSRGKYGFVYLSSQDVENLSNLFSLTKTNFKKKYCSYTNGFLHLSENKKNKECKFLKNNKCTVYKQRPMQCRTWPFWPENMNSKKWNNEIMKFCPGIGKGQLFTKKNIEKKLHDEKSNEKKIYNENIKFNFQLK